MLALILPTPGQAYEAQFFQMELLSSYLLWNCLTLPIAGTFPRIDVWDVGRAERTRWLTFLPPTVQDYRVHADPEFETFTYGDDTWTARAASLATMDQGDQL